MIVSKRLRGLLACCVIAAAITVVACRSDPQPPGNSHECVVTPNDLVECREVTGDRAIIPSSGETDR